MTRGLRVVVILALSIVWLQSVHDGRCQSGFNVIYCESAQTVFAFHERSGFNVVRARIELGTGRIAWRFTESARHLTASPVMGDGFIVLATVDPNDTAQAIEAFSATTGERSWSVSVQRTVQLMTAGELVLFDRPGGLGAVDARTGRIQFDRRWGPAGGVRLFDATSALALTSAGTINAASGRLLGRYDLASPSAGVFSGDIQVVGSRLGAVIGLNRGGRQVWKHVLGADLAVVSLVADAVGVAAMLRGSADVMPRPTEVVWLTGDGALRWRRTIDTKDQAIAGRIAVVPIGIVVVRQSRVPTTSIPEPEIVVLSREDGSEIKVVKLPRFPVLDLLCGPALCITSSEAGVVTATNLETGTHSTIRFID